MLKYRYIIMALALIAITGSTQARAQKSAPTPVPSFGNESVFGGRPDNPAKTVVVDTQLIMGPWNSGAPYNGQFQSPSGGPSWNGWTSIDLTQSTDIHWHVDTYHAVSGTYSAWCGDASYAACTGSRPDPDTGGYGNAWREILEWRGTVADRWQPCTVDINAIVSYDSEPGYDYSFVSVVQAGTTTDLWYRDGTGVAEPLELRATYVPEDYEGLENNQVVVQFRFESDGSWSDEDCSWATAGAIQVDDVQIILSNGTGYSHDFEDGLLGEFEALAAPGVGDYAQIWTGLQVAPGADNGNHSPMVAFVDDGIVVPGTGGSECITWCYGPDGYIVNNTGGLAGPGAHIHNAIMSPVMPWPDGDYDGSDYSFDVWRDEALSWSSPGVFFTWAVRSTAEPAAENIVNANWRDRNFLYYSPASWARMVEPVGDLLEPNPQWI